MLLNFKIYKFKNKMTHIYVEITVKYFKSVSNARNI